MKINEETKKKIEEHYTILQIRNKLAKGLESAGYECSSIQEEKRIKEEKENE